MGNSTPAAEKLEAIRERLRIPYYLLAPAAGIHPSRVARMLTGREPLPAEIARRIDSALAAELEAIRLVAMR